MTVQEFKNLSFEDVLSLYIKLRIKISTGSDKEC